MIKVQQKLKLARIVNRMIRCCRSLCGLNMRTTARRGGVLWDLDLNEGIDLAIYLYGAYELRTVQAYRKLIKPGDVVFDIGANIGAHTLRFAQAVSPTGTVHAFEPTDYAFQKLLRNFELNPILGGRVRLNQMLLCESMEVTPPEKIYSSWPLSGQDHVHEQHGGRLEEISKAQITTLDAYCEANKVDKIDFVKIDVDGNEYTVLKGWENTLRQMRPPILIELAPFAHDSGKSSFDDMIVYLKTIGYKFYDLNARNKLPTEPRALREIIPDGSGVNALLM